MAVALTRKWKQNKKDPSSWVGHPMARKVLNDLVLGMWYLVIKGRAAAEDLGTLLSHVSSSVRPNRVELRYSAMVVRE